MGRPGPTKRIAWTASIAFATAASISIAGTGHAQRDCNVLVPAQGKIELYSEPTGSVLIRVLYPAQLRDIVITCMGTENGRYHIHSAKGDGWVPTWELARTGPQDPLQLMLRPPKNSAAPLAQEPSRDADASSLAVSPTRSLDRSTTAPLPNQSPKIEKFFGNGTESLGTESPSKAIR